MSYFQTCGGASFSCPWSLWLWCFLPAWLGSVPACAAASPLPWVWESSIYSQVREMPKTTTDTIEIYIGFSNLLWFFFYSLVSDDTTPVIPPMQTMWCFRCTFPWCSSTTSLFYSSGLCTLGTVCCFLAGEELYSLRPKEVEGSLGWSLYLALISFPLQMMAAALFLWAARSHRTNYTRMTAYRVA